MDMDGKEEEEAAAFVRKEVADWDDEVKSRTRFKALSGQRSDWEALYCFWRDLIVKTARHLHIFLIRPSRLSRLWFRRRPDGLSPLCLDRVLLEMHRAGDLLLPPTTASSSRLPHILRRALNFLTLDDRPVALTADYYILAPLLEVAIFILILTCLSSLFSNSDSIIGTSPWSRYQIVGKLLD